MWAHGGNAEPHVSALGNAFMGAGHTSSCSGEKLSQYEALGFNASAQEDATAREGTAGGVLFAKHCGAEHTTFVQALREVPYILQFLDLMGIAGCVGSSAITFESVLSDTAVLYSPAFAEQRDRVSHIAAPCRVLNNVLCRDKSFAPSGGVLEPCTARNDITNVASVCDDCMHQSWRLFDSHLGTCDELASEHWHDTRSEDQMYLLNPQSSSSKMHALLNQGHQSSHAKLSRHAGDQKHLLDPHNVSSQERILRAIHREIIPSVDQRASHQEQASMPREAFSTSSVWTVRAKYFPAETQCLPCGTLFHSSLYEALRCFIWFARPRVRFFFYSIAAARTAAAMTFEGPDPVCARICRGVHRLLSRHTEIDDHHVKSHSGDPWNELVDRICVAGSLGCVLCAPWSSVIAQWVLDDGWPAEWFFINYLCHRCARCFDGNACGHDRCDMDCGADHSIPMVENLQGSLGVSSRFRCASPPAVVAAMSTELAADIDQYFCVDRRRGVLASSPARFQATIVYCNVQSLREAAKREGTVLQFSSIQASIVGLQETRSSATSVRQQSIFICASSQCDSGGNFGCEIWVDSKLSEVVSGRKGAIITCTNSAILHEDPRRLRVSIVTDELRVLVLSCHAPLCEATTENPDPLTHISKCWRDTYRISQQFRKRFDQFFGYTDANTTLGSMSTPMTEAQGSGKASAHVRPLLHFMDALSLIASSTLGEFI